MAHSVSSSQMMTSQLTNRQLIKPTYLAQEPEPKQRKDPEDAVSYATGDFGSWQLRLSIMMALLKFPIAWYQLNIIFLAPPQDFWCVKPVSFYQYTDREWRQMCAPQIEEYPCLIFDPDILAMAPTLDRALIPLVECHNFEYDLSVFRRTIVSDWDLVCDKRWLVNFTQCVIMAGILIGGVLFGIIADKHGRKTPLMVTIVLQSVASYISCCVQSIWAFIISSFFLALASGGVGIISFVLTMEVVGGKWRTIIPILYQLPFSFGNPVLAGLAYWLRDWRKLQFALSTLSAIFILYWLCIDESPRWLLAKEDTGNALDILKKAAKQNKIKFDDTEVKRMLPKAVGGKTKAPGFMAFLRSKNMRLITIMLSVNWFCTGISYYTFAQYLGSIGDNIFVTVVLSGLISTPGALICVFIVMKMGRKMTVAIFQLATAICFIFILLIPKYSYANDWPRLVFTGIGFGGMAVSLSIVVMGSVPALLLFSGELFPTLGRNVGVSGVSIFARIGSMVAPLLADLDSILPNLTLIVLAITSFAQILLLLPLPETMNRPLSDTLDQAEELVASRAKGQEKVRVK